MVSNLKEAKELLEKYKSITLEQLKKAFEEDPSLDGGDIIHHITGFGDPATCMLCLAVNEICTNCIYCFRLSEDHMPCLDTIYNEICFSENAEDLFKAVQKRISYLTHVIQFHELQK